MLVRKRKILMKKVKKVHQEKQPVQIDIDLWNYFFKFHFQLKKWYLWTQKSVLYDCSNVDKVTTCVKMATTTSMLL